MNTLLTRFSLFKYFILRAVFTVSPAVTPWRVVGAHYIQLPLRPLARKSEGPTGVVPPSRGGEPPVLSSLGVCPLCRRLALRPGARPRVSLGTPERAGSPAETGARCLLPQPRGRPLPVLSHGASAPALPRCRVPTVRPCSLRFSLLRDG